MYSNLAYFNKPAIRLARRGRLTAQEYIQGILEGDRILLSRAITLIESNLSSDSRLASDVMKGILSNSGKSIRIGITGVPGVGKSTFIEAFGLHLIEKGLKVAVLAIDPTSRKSGGSILGDKTRMETLSVHPRAYIRPTPSGETLGGVANKTRETMLFCEAAGFDVIIVETVGVGQSEIAVKDMTDFFLLLMLAGAGDELQGIKKGIMEMADALVINKADGDNKQPAKRAAREYENALHLFPPTYSFWYPKVSVCSALRNEGVNEVWETIDDFVQKSKQEGYFKQNRKTQNIRWFHSGLVERLRQQFYQDSEMKGEILRITQQLEQGNLSPVAEAEGLVNKFLKKD